MVIGLTGVFGSGKSTVLDIFRQKGAAVLSSDEIVHALFREPTVRKKIRSVFGPGVFRGEDVDRAALAKIVFNRPAERRKLEAIIHPLVKRRIRQAIKRLSVRSHRLETETMFVAEVPLLFESRFAGVFDRIICVSAPARTIIRRMRTRGVKQAEVELRWSGQWPPEEKEKRSHFVIDNGGRTSETRQQIDRLLTRLKRNGN